MTFGCINKAAKVLDGVDPLWYTKVDTEILDGSMNCVLLQISRHDFEMEMDVFRQTGAWGNRPTIFSSVKITSYPFLGISPFWKLRWTHQINKRLKKPTFFPAEWASEREAREQRGKVLV